ncbi:MAG: DUF4440 domain-containing protein [Bacteroidota bacterium]
MKVTFSLWMVLVLHISLFAQDSPLSPFDALVGKTWVAEGQWADGSVFKQEVVFEYDLNKQVVKAHSMGFTDEVRTVWGARSHGIRQWDAEKQQIVFWEFDTFGGLTQGTVQTDSSGFYYEYEYGDGAQKNQLTDAWEQIDPYTYSFKVGVRSNDQWQEVYLQTKFTALPAFTGDRTEIDAIMAQGNKFSEYYVSGNTKALVDIYTEEGKIFPGRTEILKGKEALTKYWSPSEGYVMNAHKVRPEEIVVVGDTAYDYGYYMGRSTNPKGETADWGGKYVIIWKKVDGKWLMDIDIWN